MAYRDEVRRRPVKTGDERRAKTRRAEKAHERHRETLAKVGVQPLGGHRYAVLVAEGRVQEVRLPGRRRRPDPPAPPRPRQGVPAAPRGGS